MDKPLIAGRKFNKDHYINGRISYINDDGLLGADQYLYRSIWISKLIKKGSILDLGCHTGVVSLQYAYRGWPVVGVDLNKKAIEFCNRFLKRYKITTSSYIQSSIEDVEISETFDNIIICEVIEHVEDPDKILDLAERHLNPGGTIFISTPDWDGPYGINNNGDGSEEHVRIYKPEELKELIESRGGKIKDFQVKQLIYLAYGF